MTTLKIIDEITNHLATLPFVERVILFGSRARGDHDERSDIDLAVSCPNITASQWLEIWDYIDDAPTLYSIDIVQFEKVNIKLQENIRKEGLVLYERREN